MTSFLSKGKVLLTLCESIFLNYCELCFVCTVKRGNFDNAGNFDNYASASVHNQNTAEKHFCRMF